MGVIRRISLRKPPDVCDNSSMVMFIWIATRLVHADPAGQLWLQQVDDRARVDQATVELSITVTDANGVTSERTIEIWQRGDDQRLVRMVAPPRLAGVSLLARPGNQLHLFLPHYPPARRVLDSKRSDSFMGTDFAIEDLSRMTYTGTYDASVVSVEDGLTRLRLTHTSDPNANPPELWIDDDAVIHRIDHFGKRGNVVRRLQLDDVRPVGSAAIAHRIRVTDLTNNRVTVATINRIDTDTPIDDSVFTVMNLERP